MTKRCVECGTIKSIDEFYRNKMMADGKLNTCKSCYKDKNKEYNHSKKGVVARILSHQKHSSKARSHRPPTYSLSELREWVHSQPNWNELYAAWVDSNFNKNLTPSTDRLDDYKGYSFDNIRLVTWRENIDKMVAERISGANNKISKAVVGINVNTNKVVEFHSTRSAAREFNIGNSNISASCLGRKGYKTAGGYCWKYKNDKDGN